MKTTLYHPAVSFLHGLDPRTKLAALAFLTAAALLFDDPVFLLWPLAGLLAVSMAGRVFRVFLAGTLVLTAFGALPFLAWPLFLTLRGQGGPAAWVFGAGVGLRLTEILLVGYLVMLTTRTEEILAALSRLGLPFPAVFSMGLTFRLLPSLLATAGHVVEAQRLRGLRFDEGGLVKRARRYVPLLVPILACSLRTVHQMSWALEAKGFGSGVKRMSYIVLRMRARDWAVVVASAVLLAAAIWAHFRHVGVLPTMYH